MRLVGWFLAIVRRPDSTGQLARGSGVALLANLCAALANFVSQVYIARKLGAAGFGTYMYILLWLYIFGIGTSLGHENVLLRFLPQYRARGEWGLFAGVYRHSFHVALIAAPVLGGIAAVGLWFTRNWFSPDFIDSAWIGCLILPIFSFNRLQGICLQAVKRVGWSKFPQMILQPLLLVVITAGYSEVAHGQLSSHKILCFYLAASGISLVVGTVLVATLFKRAAQPAVPKFLRREWSSTGRELMLLGGLVQLSGQMDLLMLGGLRTMAEYGIYAAAFRLSALAVFGHTAILAMVTPLIGEAHARNDRNDLQKIVTHASIGATLTSLPVALGMAILGEWILHFFGPQFTAAYVPLLILLVGNLANALTGPVGSVLVMTGHQRDSMSIQGAALILAFGLNLIFTPRYGIIAASCSSSACLTFTNVAMLVSVWYRLGILSTVITPPSRQ